MVWGSGTLVYKSNQNLIPPNSVLCMGGLDSAGSNVAPSADICYQCAAVESAEPSLLIHHTAFADCTPVLTAIATNMLSSYLNPQNPGADQLLLNWNPTCTSDFFNYTAPPTRILLSWPTTRRAPWGPQGGGAAETGRVNSRFFLFACKHVHVYHTPQHPKPKTLNPKP